MKLSLGLSSIAVDRRNTHEWLFDLMAEAGVRNLQLATFFEMYFVDDEWLLRLGEKAAKRGIRIKSLFTAVRELGGFMTGDPAMEKVSRDNYLRLLNVAQLLKADSAGSNMGAVYRERMDYKQTGIQRGVELLKEMSFVACEKGLKAITIEPMSCLAEPPTLPEESDAVMGELAKHHNANPKTVPVLFCADIAHGYADINRKVIYDNYALFEGQIPYIYEFHFKNTDEIFNSTFGFAEDECKRGIVKLDRFRALLEKNADRFPVSEVTGYLELNGPKLGRDYTDVHLAKMLKESLKALRDAFDL